jgi:ubiquitin-conjugating enzyme E2 J1
VLRGAAGTPFQGGLYHGRIILPSQYPHKPPEFLFLSPNGRFEVGKKICLSISQHHPELWQPGWDIRTALIAIQSFMPTPGSGAIAALDYTDEERRLLATRSLDACKATLSKSGMLDNFTEFLAAPREPAGASAPSPAAAGPPAARPTAPAPAPAPENQAPVFNTPPPSHSGARPSPGATTAPTPPAVAAATPPSIPPESSAACAPGDRQADRASARESQPPVTPAPAVSPARPAAAATTPGSEGLRRRPAAAGGAVHPGAPLGASPPPLSVPPTHPPTVPTRGSLAGSC